MKAFVLLLTIAFASRFADVESRMTMQQITTALKNVRKSCITKTGVDKEVLDATTRDGVWPAEDKALACYFQCNLKMMKALTKEGTINVENVMRQADTMLPEEYVDRFKAMVERCVQYIKSDDPCEGIYQYTKCNWDTSPDVWFWA